jgi:copper chaperone CopZ
MIVDQKMGVVMKIEMHCEACSEEMKRRILNIKGTISAC